MIAVGVNFDKLSPDLGCRGLGQKPHLVPGPEFVRLGFADKLTERGRRLMGRSGVVVVCLQSVQEGACVWAAGSHRETVDRCGILYRTLHRIAHMVPA
jgi:hypothetical protein